MNTKISDFIAGRSDFLMLYDENGRPGFLMERNDFEKGTHQFIDYILDDKDNSYSSKWNEHYRNYFGEYKDPKRKGKNTGGKKPYVMLMSNEVVKLKEQLKNQGVKNCNEVIGCISDLSYYMEYGTGKLIDRRQRLKKKQIPLKYNDLLEISGYSKGKFEDMMKIMKNNNLLSYEKPSNETNGGYFISTNIIKKGKKGVIE